MKLYGLNSSTINRKYEKGSKQVIPKFTSSQEDEEK